MRGRISIRAASPLVRSLSKKSGNEPLYLNPHAWKGLPADRVFELHRLRKTNLEEKYVPNDDERHAILSTFESLSKAKPTLDYVYEIDNFKERYMNNTPSNLRGLPPKSSNVNVINRGLTPHKQRRNEQLNRISAFEMPLLAKFRIPYQPSQRKNNPISLAFNTDFSDDKNKFNRRVKLAVKIEDLQLNEQEQRNLKLLAGTKFNFNTNEVHFSTDRFEEAAQNARWLVTTFNKLLNKAKELKDEFADVPLDTRHMRPAKKEVKYVEAWKRVEDAPVEKYQIVNKLVDGVKIQREQEFIANYSP